MFQIIYFVLRIRYNKVKLKKNLLFVSIGCFWKAKCVKYFKVKKYVERPMYGKVQEQLNQRLSTKKPTLVVSLDKKSTINYILT